MKKNTHIILISLFFFANIAGAWYFGNNYVYRPGYGYAPVTPACPYQNWYGCNELPTRVTSDCGCPGNLNYNTQPIVDINEEQETVPQSPMPDNTKISPPKHLNININKENINVQKDLDDIEVEGLKQIKAMPVVNINIDKTETDQIKTMPIVEVDTDRGEGNIEDKYENLIVMFTKDGCPYCDYMKPIMQQAEQMFGDKITFLFLDVKNDPSLAAKYNFSTVPHIVYFKSGVELEAHGSGDKTMTLEDIKEKIMEKFNI